MANSPHSSQSTQPFGTQPICAPHKKQKKRVTNLGVVHAQPVSCLRAHPTRLPSLLAPQPIHLPHPLINPPPLQACSHAPRPVCAPSRPFQVCTPSHSLALPTHLRAIPGLFLCCPTRLHTSSYFYLPFTTFSDFRPL